MHRIKKRRLWYLVVILAMLASPVMADITYTSEAAFTGALQPGYSYKDLTGLHVQSGFAPGPSTMAFGPTNGFSWTVSVANTYGDATGLYEVTDGLSTWLSYDVMTFNFVGSPTLVKAVGGTFFANNNAGSTINGAVEVLLNDGTKATLTTPGFRGFIADVGIASMKVWSDVGVSHHTDGTVYAGVGELYVGTGPVSSVPEPLSILLLVTMLAGAVGAAKLKLV